MFIAPELLLALAMLGIPAESPASKDRRDPQELLALSEESLQRGDLAAARSAASRLRQLLSADPGWDPDGNIAAALLPALEVRIARLGSATSRLSKLLAEPSATQKPARPVDDPDALLDHLRAAHDEAARIDAELGAIARSVPPGQERGALMQSEAYKNGVRAAGLPPLPVLSDDFKAGVFGKGAETERVRLLLTRLDSLKREVIALSVERETTQGQLLAAVRTNQRQRASLLEFIGSAPGEAVAAEAARLTELGTALAHRIRDRIDSVRSMKQQRPLEKVLLMEELERFRMVNEVALAEGSRDLAPRLEALATAIGSVPVVDSGTTEQSIGCLGRCFEKCR